LFPKLPHIFIKNIQNNAFLYKYTATACYFLFIFPNQFFFSSSFSFHFCQFPPCLLPIVQRLQKNFFLFRLFCIFLFLFLLFFSSLCSFYTSSTLFIFIFIYAIFGLLFAVLLPPVVLVNCFDCLFLFGFWDFIMRKNKWKIRKENKRKNKNIK